MASASSDTPAVQAIQATKMFLDGAVIAYRNLNLEIRAQEILCIVGPSGCGKTTLLRSIAGLTDLSSGQLLVHGKPVKGPPDGVAMVFQHFGLLPWKTVYDNGAFGLRMNGADEATVKERVSRYLDLVGLRCFDKSFPHQLSGGMQQRVGLVRALGPWRPDRDSVNEVGSPLFRVPGGESTRRGTCGGVGITFLRPWPI